MVGCGALKGVMLALMSFAGVGPMLLAAEILHDANEVERCLIYALASDRDELVREGWMDGKARIIFGLVFLVDCGPNTTAIVLISPRRMHIWVLFSTTLVSLALRLLTSHCRGTEGLCTRGIYHYLR